MGVFKMKINDLLEGGKKDILSEFLQKVRNQDIQKEVNKMIKELWDNCNFG